MDRKLHYISLSSDKRFSDGNLMDVERRLAVAVSLSNELPPSERMRKWLTLINNPIIIQTIAMYSVH